jgi:hypothetical protein
MDVYRARTRTLVGDLRTVLGCLMTALQDLRYMEVRDGSSDFRDDVDAALVDAVQAFVFHRGPRCLRVRAPRGSVRWTFSASTNGYTFTGSLHEESRGPIEDLDVLLEPAVLPPQRRQLFLLAAGQPVTARAGVPLGLAHPLAHRSLVRSKSRATCPIDRSPRWHTSTISALNSDVNERRGRCCRLRSTFSMMDILSGDKPLILDVRQRGSARGKCWGPGLGGDPSFAARPVAQVRTPRRRDCKKFGVTPEAVGGAL